MSMSPGTWFSRAVGDWKARRRVNQLIRTVEQARKHPPSGAFSDRRPISNDCPLGFGPTSTGGTRLTYHLDFDGVLVRYETFSTGEGETRNIRIEVNREVVLDTHGVCVMGWSDAVDIYKPGPWEEKVLRP